MRSTLLGCENCRHGNVKLQQADLDNNLANGHNKTRSDALRGPFRTILGRFWKMSKNVKNRHFDFQKTDLGKTFLWSPEAEIKTVDSSKYLLKNSLPDFPVVLENPLEVIFKVGFSVLAW